jgi:hypothetical protein
MTRALLTVALSVALPAAAAAQTPPPPPVPPPAPPAPVVVTPRPAPLAPLPPMPSVAIHEALEAAAVAQAAVRAAPMPDFHYALGDLAHWDGFGLQPRGWAASQDPNGSYSSGLSALQSRQYERAITFFDRAIAQKSPRSDAALYWKAYAQYRNNQVQEALATIAALRRDHGQSPYLADAKVLEADVRRTPPQDIVDDDIKLLAISAQQHSTDPERAITLLEGVLGSTNSLRVKQRALFVLAQIAQPRARQILLSYAKGAGLPDLQATAIQYLAQDKKTTAEELRQIYDSTTDQRIKLAIINAYQSTGNRGGLMSVVTSTSTPLAIRQQAMSGLSGILSPQDLWQLYEKEQDVTLRRQIVRAFGSMRAQEQINQVLRTEKDPSVRRAAISSLGSLRVEQSGAMLVDLYGRETDLENKRAIISAIGSQNNAQALVDIARKETSLELKRELVQRLSEMSRTSKVAAEYLMEILKGR